MASVLESTVRLPWSDGRRSDTRPITDLPTDTDFDQTTRVREIPEPAFSGKRPPDLNGSEALLIAGVGERMRENRERTQKAMGGAVNAERYRTPYALRSRTRRIVGTVIVLLGATALGGVETYRQGKIREEEIRAAFSQGERELLLPNGERVIVKMALPEFDQPAGSKCIIDTPLCKVHYIPSRHAQSGAEDEVLEDAFLVQQIKDGFMRKLLFQGDTLSFARPVGALAERKDPLTMSEDPREITAFLKQELSLPDADQGNKYVGLDQWFRSVVVPRAVALSNGQLEKYATNGFQLSRIPTGDIIMEHPQHPVKVCLHEDGTVLLGSTKNGALEVATHGNLKRLGVDNVAVRELLLRLVEIQKTEHAKAVEIARGIENNYCSVHVPEFADVSMLRANAILPGKGWAYLQTQFSIEQTQKIVTENNVLSNGKLRAVNSPGQLGMITHVGESGETRFLGMCGHVGTLTKHGIAQFLKDYNPENSNELQSAMDESLEANKPFAKDDELIRLLSDAPLYDPNTPIYFAKEYADGTSVESNKSDKGNDTLIFLTRAVKPCYAISPKLSFLHGQYWRTWNVICERERISLEGR